MLYHAADAAKSRFFLDAILSVKLSVKFQVPLVTVDMAEEIESDFFKQLDAADKKRYKEKLSKLGVCTDPYLMDADQWSTSRNVWPSVEFPDICVYLINSPSPYTKEALKAYKSSEGYAYFVAGFVDQVLVTKISDNAMLMTAKVMILMKHDYLI